jgi:hypothetical protein
MELTTEWRELRNDGFHDSNSSQNIILVTKSKSTKIRWREYVEHVGKKRNNTGFWYGNLEEKVPLKDFGLDEWIILKWIVKNRMGLDSSGTE